MFCKQSWKGGEITTGSIYKRLMHGSVLRSSQASRRPGLQVMHLFAAHKQCSKTVNATIDAMTTAAAPGSVQTGNSHFDMPTPTLQGDLPSGYYHMIH